MRIRSITFFCNPGWLFDKSIIKKASNFEVAANPAFERVGIDVQTVRLAIHPFPRLLPNCKSESVIGFAQALEAELNPMGFEYIAIGPALMKICTATRSFLKWWLPPRIFLFLE